MSGFRDLVTLITGMVVIMEILFDSIIPPRKLSLWSSHFKLESSDCIEESQLRTKHAIIEIVVITKAQTFRM